MLAETSAIIYTGTGTISLTDCCFSGKPDGSSVYLNVASGSVSFARTCFDLAKEKSITTGNGVTVTIAEGEEEFMFGGCKCNPFKPIDPDNPPTESESSGGDQGGGAGDEPPSNLGLIVGVVVALLVVIAVVVILLILFVFRKRKSSTTTEDVDEHLDETTPSFTVTTEATVSTELAADSTPSPLFEAQSSEDVFGDSLEEEKLSS